MWVRAQGSVWVRIHVYVLYVYVYVLSPIRYVYQRLTAQAELSGYHSCYP